MEQVTIIFQPSGHRGQVSKGCSVLEGARELGENIESLCGGNETCGKCKIQVSEGSYPKYGIVSDRKHLSPWKKNEARFINEKDKQNAYRLACCAEVQGDLLIFVPEESRASKQIVSKHPHEITIDSDPAVRKYFLELSVPSKNDLDGDTERLLKELKNRDALEESCFVEDRLQCVDLDVLRSLPARLRDQKWKVTASVWMDREIIRVVSGNVPDRYGVAVDIGTTTVAASLLHLDTGRILNTQFMMNPQGKYGEDVISRVNYHVKHKDGLERMSADITKTLNQMIEAMLLSTWPQDIKWSRINGLDFPDIQKQRDQANNDFLCLLPDDIEDVSIVGNTIMHHILLGIDPKYVALAPFPPVIKKSLNIKARDLKIDVCPSAYVHLLPNQAGFVGADNTAVIIAEKPYESDPVHLIIDIGTNGELVIGNKNRLLSTSCATGPALEGAEMKFGMRAAPGAIERIAIDPKTLEVDYKVVENDKWSNYAEPGELKTCGICGSGIMDLLAELYLGGIIMKSGAFREDIPSNRFRTNLETEEEEFVIAWAAETSIGHDITITQNDIRQIQLAKAAIYCGCKLLMREWGTSQVDVVKIAGGFGLHIDPLKAMIMGLIPDFDPKQIIPVGNAAGAGARAALLNREMRTEAVRIAEKVEYVNLTSLKGFKKEFIEALHIPHKKDLFPHLESILTSEILYQK